MGLDMYLTKHIFVGANYEHRNVKGNIKITIDGEAVPIKFNRVSEIIEQVGYWRKANAIHNWMVQNIQDGNDDCHSHYLDPEKAQELLEIVNKVLADPSLADKLLPTQSGFFFGGTEYDDWYVADLRRTKEFLKDVIKHPNDSYYYQSSW